MRTLRAGEPDIDKKNVFGIAGRGGKAKLVINSPTGKLVDSDFAVTDKAAHDLPGRRDHRQARRLRHADRRARLRHATPIGDEANVCEITESAK